MLTGADAPTACASALMAGRLSAYAPPSVCIWPVRVRLCTGGPVPSLTTRSRLSIARGHYPEDRHVGDYPPPAPTPLQVFDQLRSGIHGTKSFERFAVIARPQYAPPPECGL